MTCFVYFEAVPRDESVVNGGIVNERREFIFCGSSANW